MFDLGIQELLVIFIVALLVIGPKNLPELARKMGEGFGNLKKAIVDARQEIDREMKGQPLNLDDVPSLKSDDLKRAIQEKALEAAGLSPQKENRSPANAHPYPPDTASNTKDEAASHGRPQAHDAPDGSGQGRGATDDKINPDGSGQA